MRECGLKLIRKIRIYAECGSLPMRECGLKLYKSTEKENQRGHSPCGSVD